MDDLNWPNTLVALSTRSYLWTLFLMIEYGTPFESKFEILLWTVDIYYARSRFYYECSWYITKDGDFIMNGRNILWQVEILLWRQVVILLWTVESLRWQVEILLWMVEICMIKFCQILTKFWNAKFGQILDCEGSMSPFNFDEQLPNNVINVSNVFALSIWYITCPFYLCSV